MTTLIGNRLNQPPKHRSKHRGSWFKGYKHAGRNLKNRIFGEEPEGATERSRAIADLAPEGVLRTDDHEDVHDLEVEAQRLCAERAARGNDNTDTELVNPEVHAEFATVGAAIERFAANVDAILARFLNDPQAGYRVLAASEATCQFDTRELHKLLTAEALLVAA